MYLSVVIPAYNEEKRIAKTLLEVDSYLRTQPYDYEILVVNDGSTDKTVEVVSHLQSHPLAGEAGISNLQIIDNPQNRGKGYVVRQGLLAGKGDWRLFADADNATPIQEVAKLLAQANEFDIIIASRAVVGANIINPQPWHRKMLGRLYAFLAKNVAGLQGISDSQCGFKLMSAKSAQAILPECRINGLSFDVEILRIAQRQGYKIKEVPVTWVDDADSKVTLGRMARAVLDLFSFLG